MKKSYLLCALLILLTAPPVRAANYTWVGDLPAPLGGSWSGSVFNNTNWTPEATNPLNVLLPGANDLVAFELASPNTTITVGSEAVNKILFDGTTEYTLSGGSIQLTSGDIDALRSDFTVTTEHTIGSDLVLGNSGVWEVNSDLRINGDISGSFGITKQGDGKLRFTGANTYTGTTRVASGTFVVLGSNERILDTSAIRIDSGAIFRVNGITETVNGLQNYAGSLELTNGATLRLNPTTIRTFPGTITGGSGTTLEKIGSNNQRLNNANPDFDGKMLITAGKIQLQNANALQNSTVQIDVNGGLDITTTGVNANLGALSGSGNLNFGTQTLTVGAKDADTTYTGNLTGNAASSFLKHSGSGTLTLSGGTSVIGQLNVASGSVVVTGDASLTTTSTTFELSASSLTVNGAALSTNVLEHSVGVTPTLSISDPEVGEALTVGSVSDSTFDGVIQDASGGAGSLMKTGAGTLTLNGANTYTGVTTINTGSIILQNSNALLNSVVEINVNDGLDVTTNTINATIGGLLANADLGIGTQTLTVQSATTVDSGATVSVGTGTLRAKGRVTITDGTINVGGGTLNGSGLTDQHGKTVELNGPDAVLDVTSAGLVNLNGGGGAPGNSGGNGGTLTVSDGTLNLGSLATLQARGGNGSGGWGQAGSVFLSGGAIALDGRLWLQGRDGNSYGSVGLDGGDVDLSGTAAATLSGTIDLKGGNGTSSGAPEDGGDGGALNIGDGSFTMNAGATLDLMGGEGANGGAPGASGAVNVSGGTLTLNAGLIDGSGATPSADPINLVGAAINVFDTGRLRVNDNMTIEGGSIDLSDGTDLNASGKVLQTGNDLTLTGNAELTTSSDTLIDLGGGNGVSTVGSLNGNNGGALSITGGTFDLVTSSELSSRGGDGSNVLIEGIVFWGSHGGAGSVSLSGGVSNLAGTISLVGRNGHDALGAHGKPGGDVTVSGTAAATLSGTIDLRGGDAIPGLHTSYNGGVGGDLNIQGGTFTMNGGAKLNLEGGDSPGSGNPGASGSVNVSGGTLTLNAGLIDGSGAAPLADPIDLIGAAINVSGGDVIATAAMTLDSGAAIDLSAGSVTATAVRLVDGAINFTGGRLTVDTLEGDLTQAGGTLAAGASPGTTNIIGAYDLTAGALEVELGGLVQGTEYDFYDVTGNVTLNGLLDISLISPFTPILGQSFEIIDVGGSLTGTFSGLSQGALVGNFGGTDLFIDYTSGDGNDVALVASTAGDFNLDFNVDGLDFLKWQRGFGSIYDGDDLADWEANFGSPAPLATAVAAVPEPNSVVLLALCGLLALGGTRRI